MTQWPIDQLKPYRRQEEFFPESKINVAKRQALLESIAANGLDRPIRITRDGTVMDGFHRWHIAQELGWDSIPVEVLPHDPDSPEALRVFLESNIGSIHDDPMVQARLLQERVRLAGVRAGSYGKRLLDGNNYRLKDVAQSEGISEKQLHNQLSLNKLIPPFQDLIRAGTLGTSHGAALATMTVDQQQALYDAIGDSVTTLKVADIQAAKKAPDTSALEAQMAALAAERDDLQRQLAAQTATPPPDDESSSLVESLTLQLDAAEATRQEYADEVARLKAQTPVERIVEKVVTVEKPDPAQAERIAKLESDLAAAQQKVEDLLQSGYKQADLATLQAERKAAEKRLEELRHAMARAVAPDGKADQVRMYRATVVKFIEDVQKKLKPIAGEWQQVGAIEPLPVNWMLYLDIQRTADTLESIATGLRRIPLDPVASRKHGMDGTVIIDTTATATKGEEDGDTDINAELAD